MWRPAITRVCRANDDRLHPPGSFRQAAVHIDFDDITNFEKYHAAPPTASRASSQTLTVRSWTDSLGDLSAGGRRL